MAMLFLIGLARSGYFLWTSLLQYEAYGIIEGRLISVAAPWEGTVANWQVRDGDEVKQGQILAQISNLEMEHELAAYGDELKMSQALLEAEISKVNFSVQNQSVRNQLAVAEYLQSSGELLAERAKLKELDGKFERTNKLADSNAVSRSEYEQVYFQLCGQKKKIEKLEAAVEVLRIRSNEINLNQNDGSPQLKPILAQIELTQSKIARLRERIDQGKIKAPVSGRVSKRFCLTGESARAGETVIEILEDNSIEAVLYLPQRTVDEFEVGREMDVTLEPHRRPLRCTIARLGGRFETAPESIKGYYYENQPLLPVYLKPGPEASPLMEIRVGGTIKRPYEYRKAVAKMMQEIKMAWDSWCSPSIQTAAADSNREHSPLSRAIRASRRAIRFLHRRLILIEHRLLTNHVNQRLSDPQLPPFNLFGVLPHESHQCLNDIPITGTDAELQAQTRANLPQSRRAEPKTSHPRVSNFEKNERQEHSIRHLQFGRLFSSPAEP